MPRTYRIALVFLFASCQSGPAPRSEPATEAEVVPASSRQPAEAEVRAVIDAFTAALTEGDSVSVLELLHPEVRVYEGGHAETLAQYRSGHLLSDIEFLGAVTTQTLGDQLVVREDMALYLREYAVEGRFRDQEIDARGTETLVLVPTPDGWRIRHIHWSSAGS